LNKLHLSLALILTLTNSFVPQINLSTLYTYFVEIFSNYLGGKEQAFFNRAHFTFWTY